MNEELLRKLIDITNLGILKEKPIRVLGGLLNRMYKITTTSGTYAVKHLNSEVMKRKDAKANHILAEEIANISKDNGIKCLPAKILNGNLLQEVDGNYFLIFDWFAGKELNGRELTLEHVRKIATELAIIHNINYGDIVNRCKMGKDILEVDWDLYISKMENKEIKELLIRNKDVLTKLDKKATIAAEKTHQNQVISHRDLDLPNVLWDKENNPVLIDWESAGLVNPSEEVLETAWDWSGGRRYFDKDKFNCFLETYKENGGDLSDFQDAIYANFKNKSGWLEYNLKRVCKIECIDEEEQALGEKEVIRVIDEILKFYEILDEYGK